MEEGSAHRERCCDESAIAVSLLRVRRHKMMEKDFRKEKLPEAVDILSVLQHHRTGSGCKFGAKCVFRNSQVDSQPSNKPRQSGGKKSVAPKSKSILRTTPKFLGPNRGVLVSKKKKTPHRVTIRERKAPSQGVIQYTGSHERGPYAQNFEDRSREETLRQERCARRVAWEMAKSIHKLKEKEKATFYSLWEVWSPPAPSSNKTRGNNLW